MIHVFGHRISFPVALTSGFLIFIIIGGLLLSLPLAAANGSYYVWRVFRGNFRRLCDGINHGDDSDSLVILGSVNSNLSSGSRGPRLHDFCGYVNQPLATAH